MRRRSDRRPDAADVDSAYEAAARAFTGWKRTTPSQRQAALLQIADAIEARADELNGRD